MCKTPICIKRKFHTEQINIELGKNVPALCDDGVPFYFVPCGKCSECLKSRRNDWYVRVRRQLELGNYKSVMWVRLSWDDAHIPKTKEELSKSIHLFRDRIRKSLPNNKMDYFLITELGEHAEHTKRLHIHGFLMFKRFVPYSVVRDLWHGIYGRKNGFAWTVDAFKGTYGENVAFKRIAYCMKYVFKGMLQRFKEENDLTARIFCSLGMGQAHLSSQSFRYRESADPHRFPLSITFDGNFHFRYPRYWIEKIYKTLGYRHKLSCDMLFQSMFKDALPLARGSCSKLVEIALNNWYYNVQNKVSYVKDTYQPQFDKLLNQLLECSPILIEKYNLINDLSFLK